jgi:acetolactate decarboxylase
MIFSGLIGYWAAPNDGDDTPIDGYFQVSTFARLNAGGYDGMMTVEDLLEKGDFGIGTVEGIDGEMIIRDGVAYRAGTDLVPVQVPSGTIIPFAMLTYFNTGISYEAKNVDDYNELRLLFSDLITDGHIGYAVLIETEFETITIRSVPGQVRPYPPLADLVANQTTLELQNIKGAMIGFILADDLGDINLAGFHMHFLSEDMAYGGHVLDMSFKAAGVEVDSMSSISVYFNGTR